MLTDSPLIAKLKERRKTSPLQPDLIARNEPSVELLFKDVNNMSSMETSMTNSRELIKLREIEVYENKSNNNLTIDEA